MTHAPAPLLKCLAALLLIAGLGFATSANAARIALVIGNQNYTNLEKLQKSAGDAETYGELFAARDYDVVRTEFDLDRQSMDRVIAEFIEQVQPGDTAVFVFSGHGWSDGKQNFLLGVDAPASGSEAFLKRVSIPIQNGVNGIIDEMVARGASLKVAIIDACRDNPFSIDGTGRNTGMGRGLNRMGDPPDGTFIVMSAGAGQVALDRLSDADASPNGVFTRNFVPLLEQGMTLLDATKSAQQAVSQQASLVGHQQRPAYYDETLGNNACLWGECVSPGASDSAAWVSIADSMDPQDFKGFIQFFPGSSYRSEAEERMRMLLATVAPAEESAATAQPDEGSAADAMGALNPDGGQSLLLEASDDGKTGAVPFSGTAEWSKGIDESGLPTLIGKASIPARNLSVDLLIRKNVDQGLPSSHLIEITFHMSDSFIGGSIAGLPGVLLKNEELVQGAPLVGASARIVGNSFLFALSASPEDTAANNQLLTSRKWIDLAIIYATGKRAIITLEKDTTAEAMFTEVFTAWGATANVELTGYVHLSSQKSEEEAQASAQNAASRWSHLWAGRRLEIQRADLGSKGVYYRVRLAVPSLGEAQRICSDIKATGGDCFATQ